LNYLVHILIMINIYLILGLSLNLLVGYAGMLSIAHAAFYGVGAYASTLLVMKAGFGFFPSVVAGMAAAMTLSLIIAYPSLRLKGDYFVLATIGFQVIVFSVLHNWVGLTRGPYGIPGIPHPRVFGYTFESLGSYLLLTAVLAGVALAALLALYTSPFGRVLKAIREDEIAAAALGKKVASYKIWAFLIASGIAAVSGALYAGYVTYIDPTSFTLFESIFILTIVLVGGAGNLRGPIIGVVFMMTLPEALRFLGVPDRIAPNMRQMIYGATLVALMVYRPRGIAGEYQFE